MEPNWYYATNDAEGRFTVFADANNSCSMRVFSEANGEFIGQDSAGLAGASFLSHYRNEIRPMHRLGELSGRPNLQDAVTKRKLPSDVLSELKRLKRLMVG
jgi:hypothetical protein